jgi:hypothetical protein
MGAAWLVCLLVLAHALLAQHAGADPAPRAAAVGQGDDTMASEDDDPPAARAYQRHLGLGIRLFEDRNYDAAMAEFERAYAEQQRAGPLINIALCYKGRFEYVKAIAMLERALRDHRDTVSDPPAIEKGIREMRELLGTVEIRVQPAHARASALLLLDGERVPSELAREPIQVSPGRHELTVASKGYTTTQRTFRIAPGQALTLDAKLTTDTGRLRFQAAADDVAIAVDGEPRGSGKARLTLSPGSHLLELTAGEDHYTASFAVVRGKTTNITLDDDGLLRVGKATARGPDLVAKPPVRGFYGLAVFDVGPRVGDLTDLRVAPGARLGYRIISEVGIELEFNQALNVNQTNKQDALVGTTVGRLNARLMTTTMPVRFVTTVGVGYARDFDGQGSGDGINFLVEPGFDVELSQFIVGLGAPVVVSFTSLSGSAVKFDFGGGLRAGYGFWW